MSDNNETDDVHDWTQLNYVYRRLIEVEGSYRRVDLEDKDYDENQIKLFRYVEERWNGPVWALSWWSELETDVPHFAGEATGIPDACCVWRIEWIMTRNRAREMVRCGNKRASRVGWFFEYENLHEVSPDQITWHKMNLAPSP